MAASISWGDGTRDSPVSAGTATHWYDQPGDYTVTLTATGTRDTYVATQHVTVVLPISALNQANDALNALTTNNAKATSALVSARSHMRDINGTGGALPLVAAGKLQDALQDLMSVEEQLGKAHTVDPTLNVGLIDHQLAHAAQGLVKQQIDQAINTTPRDVILKARDALDRGQASLTAGDEVGALRLFRPRWGPFRNRLGEHQAVELVLQLDHRHLPPDAQAASKADPGSGVVALPARRAAPARGRPRRARRHRRA